MPWREELRTLARPVLPAVRWVMRRKPRRERRRWLASIAPWLGGYRQKSVLDVGTDLDGETVRSIDTHFRPREVVGLNLAARERRLSPTARIARADVRDLPWEDEHFDVIVSSSAFEHITGLEQGLSEMHRVLKPGGCLFSHFGPIWSTSYGHHLWTTHRGRLYTYWNVVLPPFCHLLMTEDEITEVLLARGHDAGLSRALSAYVVRSSEQNHLFFEDYEAIFARSEFEILLLKGYDHPTLAALYNPHITSETMERLASSFPDKRHFFYDGITTLLRKR